MDKINQIWPAWHTVELIGRGGFGEVYKAKRELQGEIFYSAVKVIRIPKEEQDIKEMLEEGHTSQSIRYYYESVAKDLMNEIKVLETLKSAANVMNIEDFDVRERKEEIGWEVYIRMELLENLDAYRQTHTMTVNDVVKLGIDLCSALEYCEKSKIIHRDIKPKNIFVDRYGSYKLGDFGIARQMEKTQSTLSQKGTELYMAPEVRFGLSGSSYNVDIYSLGLVMYRLLNKNRMPFEPVEQEMLTYRDREQAIERRLKGEEFPNPADADDRLSKIVKKASAFDKQERYQSAGEMKRDLLDWLKGATQETEHLHRKEDIRQEDRKTSDKKEQTTFEEEETVRFFEEKQAQSEKDGFYHFSFQKANHSGKKPWYRQQDMIKPFYVFRTEAMAGLSRVIWEQGKQIQVCLPKGTKEGQYIRLQGLGKQPDGNLYLWIQFDEEQARNGLEQKEWIVLQGLDRYPGELDAWIELGRIKQQQGLKKDAENCYTNVLEADANKVQAYMGIADLYYEQEDYEMASKWYQRALMRADTRSCSVSVAEYGTVYIRCAISEAKNGCPEKAEQLLTEAVKRKFLRNEEKEKILSQLDIPKQPKGFFGRWKNR